MTSTAVPGRLPAASKRMARMAALAAALASAACPKPYAYSFRLVSADARGAPSLGEPDSFEDGDLRAELLVDPTRQRAIVLCLTNKTEQAIQVQWTKIAMRRSDGLGTTLRPDSDLGWIEPGARRVARLVPFALPPAGDAALALEGGRFELEIPMVVRREPTRYRFRWIAHVQPVEAR